MEEGKEGGSKGIEKWEGKVVKKEGRTASNLGASLVIAVTLVQRSGDGRGGVAHGAAGILASLGSEVAGGLDSRLNGNIDGGLGDSGGDGGAGDGNNRKEGDEGGEELDHFDGLVVGGFRLGGMR